MSILYDFEPTKYNNEHTGVLRVSYNNVEFGAYMQEKAKDLMRDVEQLNMDLKREFLRAFFDDEGCMDFRPVKNKRSIRGYQKDIKVLNAVKNLLQGFGVEARVVMPNEVVITGKENLLCFEREINFSSGVYINGNRSNSRWKKDLEKRAILRMAIESYKS